LFRQPSAAAVILADRRRDRDKPARSHSRAKRVRAPRAGAFEYGREPQAAAGDRLIPGPADEAAVLKDLSLLRPVGFRSVPGEQK
jgi:hypothetical protein